MPKVKARRTGSASMETFKVENPGKGIDNFASDSMINDQESPDSLNIQIDESGIVKKRNGFASVANNMGSAGGIDALGSYYSGTTTKEAISVYQGAVSKRTTGNWSSISGATLTPGLQTNLVETPDSVSTGALYFHNGIDPMTKYNGTVLSQPGGGVINKFGISYLSHHFAAGNPSAPSTLYYSNANDGDNLTNTVLIGSNDGQLITGLGKFQNDLIIFKERSVYQFTFLADGSPSPVLINGSVGAVNHRSIENVENDLFFLSRKGVYVLGNEPNFFDTIRTNELSIRVRPTIDTISTANYKLVSAIYYNNRYHLSIPSGGTSVNNRTLVYDRRYLAWELWDTIAPAAWTEYVDSTNNLNLYMGDTAKGQIYQLDTNFTDNGAAINSYWFSKNHDVGLPSVQKQYLWVDLTFRQINGTVSIQIITDGNVITKTATLSSTATSSTGNGSLEWAKSQWGKGTGAVSGVLVSSNTPYRIPINTKARLIQIKLSNANNNETFGLLRYQIAFRPYGAYTFPSTLKLT